MKTIQITKREQLVLMTVVRSVREMVLCRPTDPGGGRDSAEGTAIFFMRRQPGMTEPDAPVPTPMELESLLERIGEE